MKLKGKAKKAFLARMQRGRNKGKRKTRSKGGGHVKRKHKSRSRRHHFGKAVRRHSRRAQGAISKYLPKTEQLVSLATSYAYGKVEKSAGTDTSHFLNSVPALVPQIGRAGNAGAIAWLIAVVTRQSTLKAIANGVLHVAAYQNGRGAEFTKTQQAFVMGARSRGRDEALVESYLRQQGA